MLGIAALPSLLSLSAQEPACSETPATHWSALHGSMKFVTEFANYKTQFVDAFAGAKVKYIHASPDAPGKWQVVHSLPDSTLQVDDTLPHLKVESVDVERCTRCGVLGDA